MHFSSDKYRRGDIAMSQQVNSHRLSSRISFFSSLIKNTYRYAGVGLSVVIPAMLWMGGMSLQSVYRFSEARYWLLHPIVKILVVVSTIFYFYTSLVNLYISIVNAYKVSTQRGLSSVIIMTMTACFAVGVGYWLW